MNNVVKVLCELININSYDVEENYKICKYINDLFSGYAKEIKYISCGGNEYKNNIVIGVNTNLKNVNNAVILSAHIDTVLPNGNETATIKNGKIYGLGACDMKAFIANIIDNIDYLKSYSSPVIIALTADEETKLNGINDVVNFFKEQNINGRFMLLGEPTNLNMVVACKGCTEFNVKITGKPAHSSNPYNGVNAIYVASKLINFIEDLNNKYFSEGASLNVGVVKGGKQVNMVAGECNMVFDLRLKNMTQKGVIVSKINNKINYLMQKYNANIEIAETLFIPPCENKNEDIINRISQKIGKDIVEVNYGTEAGYYQILGMTSLIFGAGSIDVAHSKDENVDINNLTKYSEYMVDILDELKL